MKIPGIYVEIKGDSTQLKKDMRESRQYVTEQAKGMSDSVNNALSSQQIKGSINSLVSNLGNLARSSKVAGNSFDKIGVDLKEMKRLTGLTDGEFAKLQSRLLKTRAANAQERSLRNISRSAGLTKREIRSLGRQFGLSRTQINRVTTSTNRASRSMTTLGAAAKTALTYLSFYAAASAARNIIGIADKYSLLDSKIKLVTKDSKEFDEVYSGLFKISQDTGTSFANNAANFSNLSLALKDTNITSAQTLQIFDDVNKSLVVAGATTQESISFMLQFRQAMGSGKLAGDEFRGMMESNSYWGGQLAKALDTDVAGLRKMSKEGLLTTDKLRSAFPEMSAQISEDFAQITKTIGRAMTELQNAFNDVIADSNRTVGGTSSIAEAVSNLATAITENKETISSLFTGLIDGAGWAVEGIGKVVDAWQYLYNISDAQAKGMGLSQIMGLSADDLQETLDGSFSLILQLQQVKDELTQIGKVREFEMGAMFSSWTDDAEANYQELIKQQGVLERQLATIQEFKNVGASPLEDFYDGINTEAQKSGEIVVESAKTSSTKIIRIKTDERTQALRLQKTALREQLKQEAKQSDLLLDVWGDLEEKRARSEEDALMAMYENQEEKTSLMTEGFENFAHDTEFAFRSILGDGLRGEFDSMGDAFEAFTDRMVSAFLGAIAQMAAEWAASEIADLFSDDSSSSSSSSSSGGIWDTIGDWFTDWDFAEGGQIGNGGVVSGGSGLRDDVYAGTIGGNRIMIKGGEYMMPPEQTKENFGLLEDIRAGKISSYAMGGQVGGSKDIVNTFSQGAYDSSEELIRDNNSKLDDDIEATENNAETTEENTEGLDVNSETSTKNTESTNTNTTSLDANTASNKSLASAFGGYMEGIKDLSASDVANIGINTVAGLAKAGPFGAVVSLISSFDREVEENISKREITERFALEHEINRDYGGTGSDPTDSLGREDAPSGIDHDPYGEQDNPGNGGESGGGSGGIGDRGQDDNDDGSHYAQGGYVDQLLVPPGDDGYAALSFHEGVINRKGMEALGALNNGSLFGGGDDIGNKLDRIITLLSKEKAALIVDGQEFNGWIKRTTDRIIVSRERQGVKGRAYA